MTKPQSQRPPLHRLSREIGYQRGQMRGDHSVFHPGVYVHQSQGVLERAAERSLGPPCVPLLGRGRWDGVLPPWVPPLWGDALSWDAASPRPAGALVRFWPRSTTRPVVLLPAASRGGFGGLGMPSPPPSTSKKQTRYPAKLLPKYPPPSSPNTHPIPKLLQSCSWDRAVSLKKHLPPPF